MKTIQRLAGSHDILLGTTLKIYADLSSISGRAHLGVHTFGVTFRYTESAHLHTCLLATRFFRASALCETRGTRKRETKHFLISRNDCSLLIGARCSRYRAPPLPLFTPARLAPCPLRIAHFHQVAGYSFVCTCIVNTCC